MQDNLEKTRIKFIYIKIWYVRIRQNQNHIQETFGQP